MASYPNTICPYRHPRPGRHGDVDEGELSAPRESAALERFKIANSTGARRLGRRYCVVRALAFLEDNGQQIGDSLLHKECKQRYQMNEEEAGILWI